MKTNMLLYSLFLLLIAACKTPAPVNEAPLETPPPIQTGFFNLPYQFNDPDTTFKLSRKLDEISGLGLHTDGKHLVAVQDEDGIVFIIDKQSSEITSQFEFWKDGDYEGIEMVGDIIFVAKSSGTVYCILHAGMENQEVVKHNEFLTGENDIEGITYDPARHRLLIACKGKAGEGEAYKLTKGIYGFDLKSMTLDSVPAYVVSLDEVHDYLKTSPAIRKLEELQDFFTPDESIFGFSPSGLAVHPISGDLYIISSVGKMLMILSPEGKIRHIEKLKKKVHAQPEGICFDNQGGLYIANEGKSGTATLHYFSPRTD